MTPPKRKAITAKLARAIIIAQLQEGYVSRWDTFYPAGTPVGDEPPGAHGALLCPLCRERISATDKTQWEHMTPLALGGADDETNIRLAHDACSKAKTNGAAHVKVDGDASKIAKAKRIAAREALERGEAKAQKHKPKIQSRGFDKTLRKKFNGQVEKRT